MWLAYDDELACDVAMKEIALPDMPTDAGEHPGLPWMVMEQVPWVSASPTGM